MRVPWSGFPPVIINGHYKSEGVDDGRPGLSEHRDYKAAKKARDAEAAERLLYDLIRPELLDDLYDQAMDHGVSDENVSVVAPVAFPEDSNNVLALGFAYLLENELGWKVEDHIFQAKIVSRDHGDAWHRIAHPTDFRGNIEPGRKYVIVDDILTLGGTLADLRGFIEMGGGSVIGAAVLSSRTPDQGGIALLPETHELLTTRFGSDLDEFCRQELGHDCSCITEPEAGVFLRCRSIARIRSSVYRARNIGTPRGDQGGFRTTRAKVRRRGASPPRP
jgi:hypothetical protein